MEDLIVNLDSVLESICIVVCNNGGGYVNYSLFWEIIGFNGGGVFIGDIVVVIDSELGGFDKFKEDFVKVVIICFGFGWVWFVVGKDGKLFIISMFN